MMKLSCTCSMVPGETMTEKANNLKKWGYDGIGIFVDYKEWNQDLESEILNLEKNTGIKPVEFCFGGEIYGHLMDDDKKVRDESRKMYKEATAMCAKIGAITELEYQYGAQDPLPLFDPYAKMNKEQEKAFLEMYEEICAVADGSEAYVLIEPINRYEAPFMNNVDHCLEVLEKMQNKHAGILLDMFHLSIEEADIPAKIRKSGSYTKYVHLGDNNRLMPGYGNLDWKGIIKALKDVNYDGYMSMECSLSGDPEKTLPEAAKFMKKLIEEV